MRVSKQSDCTLAPPRTGMSEPSTSRRQLAPLPHAPSRSSTPVPTLAPDPLIAAASPILAPEPLPPASARHQSRMSRASVSQHGVGEQELPASPSAVPLPAPAATNGTEEEEKHVQEEVPPAASSSSAAVAAAAAVASPSSLSPSTSVPLLTIPPALPHSSSSANPSLNGGVAPKPAASPTGPTPDQMALLSAILRGETQKVLTQFNHVNWNFTAKVVGRTAPQSPLALLLRPELNYGNLARMSRADQRRLVEHALLGLDRAFTPVLDSMGHARPDFRQSMSVHVLQAVYQGRVDLLELMYSVSLQRAREGWGVGFNLRDRFFGSRITLLHMAAHDGHLAMAKWVLQHWDAEREKDPSNASGLNDAFTAEVEDAAGQTPLFWTFARGKVSVELARYLVEERGCDLFRVFTLRTSTPRLGADGKALLQARLDPLTQQPVFDQLQTPPRVILDPVMSVRVDGYCSAFSLAIQLAPDFVAENLLRRARNEGSRFSHTIMRFDFSGVTLRPAQIEQIQKRVDDLNTERSERERTEQGQSKSLEGNAFLREAHSNLENAFTQIALLGKAGAGGGGGGAGRKDEAAAEANPSSSLPSHQPIGSPQTHMGRSGASSLNLLDPIQGDVNDDEGEGGGSGDKEGRFDLSLVEELRFLPQEYQGHRQPKETWDTFFYSPTPLSALELMVRHGRRSLLLTPLMTEVTDRLWSELKWQYRCMAACYVLFGSLFAVNTALWPRTAELLPGPSAAQPPALRSGVSDADWVGWFLTTNMGCSILVLVLFAFYAKVVYEGPHLRQQSPASEPANTGKKDVARVAPSAAAAGAAPPPNGSSSSSSPSSAPLATASAPASAALAAAAMPGAVYDSLRTLGLNVLNAFSTSSARVDLAIVVLFILVQGIQWGLICHVPQFSGQPVCDGGLGDLSPTRVSALAWFSSALHLLLGLKILELLSILPRFGSLYSTLLFMLEDVARFFALFAVGVAAFGCAAWVVLKDVFGAGFDSALGMGAPAAGVALGTSAGEPAYSYGSAWLDVLLWVVHPFEFDRFGRTPVQGVSALGKLLFLLFMLIMVLVALNVMVAMFVNTYADVVKDSSGEAALRRSHLLAQLLRLAGGRRSRAARRFVARMGVENNCGIDRIVGRDASGAVNVEAEGGGVRGGGGGGGRYGGGGRGAGGRGGGGWAETVYDNFQDVKSHMRRLQHDLADIKLSQERAANDEGRQRKHRAAVRWQEALSGVRQAGRSEQL